MSHKKEKLARQNIKHELEMKYGGTLIAFKKAVYILSALLMCTLIASVLVVGLLQNAKG